MVLDALCRELLHKLARLVNVLALRVFTNAGLGLAHILVRFQLRVNSRCLTFRDDDKKTDFVLRRVGNANHETAVGEALRKLGLTVGLDPRLKDDFTRNNRLRGLGRHAAARAEEKSSGEEREDRTHTPPHKVALVLILSPGQR